MRVGLTLNITLFCTLFVSHIPSHTPVRVNSGAINITHNSRTAEMVNGCMDDGIDGGVDRGWWI